MVTGVEVIEPIGAFYIFPSIEKFVGRRTPQGHVIQNSTDFASALLESEGVALVPGVEFGMEGYIRISYTVSDARLEDAMNRFKKFATSLT